MAYSYDTLLLLVVVAVLINSCFTVALLRIFQVMSYLRTSLISQTVKNLACNAGDLGLVPGLGRSAGGGHNNTLQYL